MLEAGTVLQQRYRIQKQIGQGGMGAVYVATDERFGSTVAIKETFFSDAGFGKAFEREARLLNNLRHPALPRVSDHFSDQHGQFLVMEYIAGQDMSEMMEREGKAFPVSDVLGWASQLLDALDFLHTQETPVIHRDIKPQNLKLTPRGQVILLDFGLAKGNPTDAQHQTAAKSVFGYSRNYASIEQIQGTGTDPRSDIYSLGATIYHLMTGFPPADALTRAMQVLNGDKDPLKPANLVNPEISAGVADVLQRAMALNSNQRPSSALAMQAMLADSEKTAVGGFGESSAAVGILHQDTKIVTGMPGGETQQASIQTGVLPVADSVSYADQTAVSPLNFHEDETSLRDGKRNENWNIQIPVAAATKQIPSSAKAAKTGGSKRGLAFGLTAFGGVAIALGGFFVFRSPRTTENVGNSNVPIQKNIVSDNTSPVLPAANNVAGGENLSVESPTNANSNQIAVKKETAEKSDVKTVVESQKPPADAKDAAKDPPKPAKPPESDPKVAMDDGEGTKIYENGKIVSSDGTIVHPNGKITQNGKVIVGPNPRIQRPQDAKPPVLTPEQMQNLTPQQRRRLRQMIENQKRRENIPQPPQ